MPRNPRLLLTALLLGLMPMVTPAQEPDQRWYRVELLIFSHEGSSAEAAEQWEVQPPLAYPPSYRFLRDPEREAANLARWPGAESEVDERGVQTITVPQQTGDEPEDPRLAAEDIPVLGAVAEPNAVIEDLAEEAPARPSPFVKRPVAELEFRGKAAFMQRSGRYLTLFHESWIQPVSDRESAIPLVIDRSGDLQDWPRLQGSVRLFVARFLHLETALWLNTDGSYLPGDWRMPAPPLGPASLVVIEPAPPEPLDSSPEDYALNAAGDDPQTAMPVESGPVYPWRHAAALTQSRRMRSTEVHYIDHPLLGLVIKLTPLAEEELQSMAEAEDQAGAAQAL